MKMELLGERLTQEEQLGTSLISVERKCTRWKSWTSLHVKVYPLQSSCDHAGPSKHSPSASTAVHVQTHKIKRGRNRFPPRSTAIQQQHSMLIHQKSMGSMPFQCPLIDWMSTRLRRGPCWSMKGQRHPCNSIRVHYNPMQSMKNVGLRWILIDHHGLLRFDMAPHGCPRAQPQF